LYTQDVIVEIVKSGGFMGLDQRMEISNNGHGILTGTPDAKPEGFDLSEEEMDDLRRVLADAGFSKYAGQDFPCEGADQFTYTVAHAGDTVSMCDNRIPEELGAAVGLLESIAREHGGM
jgi:hypothetical protein